MGDIFRSEEMVLIQLFIQAEAARSTVQELGELGLVQFRDLNPDVNAFQRAFVQEIRRCDEMERKLRFLTSQIEKHKVKTDDFVPQYSQSRSLQQIEDLDSRLTELEEEVKQMNANEDIIQRNYLELIELRHVLTETDSLFEEAEMRGSYPMAADQDEVTAATPLLGGHEQDPEAIGLVDERARAVNYVTGVINRDKQGSFERVLWRVLRGNLYLRTVPIDELLTDPETQKDVEKDVFIIFAHGESTQSKIRKICESFGAHLYPCPDSHSARQELIDQVKSRMTEMSTILSKTADHCKQTLARIAVDITRWNEWVIKEKATYHAMNMFSRDASSSKVYVAEGWAPKRFLEEVQQALRRGTDVAKSNVPTIMNVISTRETPPTYFRNNKFTAGFQSLIDAYGIAAYQEVNPTPYTIITFPFLFAVMFGDLGHGFILALFGVWLCVREKQLAHWSAGEMTGMIYGGRYLILLMGLFSIYNGLVYNDIFSKVIGLFESGWEFAPSEHDNGTYVGEFNGNVYPFGLDKGWHAADNLLIFTNSYKMKLSVIFGVIQMTFGIILSVFNHLHFRRWVSVFHEFIPQLLFMTSIFGYLVFAIIYKWLNPRDVSLLNMLIYMFLSPGKVDPEATLFEGQATIQLLLIIIAVICVPWMLLVKPFYLRYKNRANSYRVIPSHAEDGEEVAGSSDHHDDEGHGGDDHGHGDHFDFGEVMIHQLIHTIEFVLGSISNTASYLRLWALSLAHAQLSDVLWRMTLGNFMNSATGPSNAFGIFIGFGGWFALTIFILICMEGLSAFLHALRLHWVEFNSKFYAGTGIKFTPFSYAAYISGGVNDE